MTARWLLDLEEYNEWMNEEDYLVEEEVCYVVEKSRVRVSTSLQQHCTVTHALMLISTQFTVTITKSYRFDFCY